MKTFGLNDIGDLEFDGQNSIKMIEGNEEKLQSLKLLLGTNTGEWFLNIFHGLAYFDILGKKQINQDEIRAAIYEALEQEERIDEVLSLNINFENNNRKLTINFSVRMDGQIVNGEEVI